MSMSANRHPEIRASLVPEPRDAALTREHNHANVLCFGSLNTDTRPPKRLSPRSSPPNRRRTPPAPGRQDQFGCARHRRRRPSSGCFDRRGRDPPAEQHRAHRLGELCQQSRPRGPGLGPHQQICGGLPRQAAGTAVARMSTWSSSWPSTAPRNSSAPSMPTSSPTADPRRTPPSTSPCSSTATRSSRWTCPTAATSPTATQPTSAGKFYKVVHYGVSEDDGGHRLRPARRAGRRVPA